MSVAKYMKENARKYNLDPEEMYTLGCLINISPEILYNMGMDAKYTMPLDYQDEALPDDVDDEIKRIHTLLQEAVKNDKPEYWDAYDRSFNRIPNVILKRDAYIPDGLYHLVCDVLVRKDDKILLMQRSATKNFPLMWEATAGGSALMGETPENCIRRELLEETGIKAKTLKFLGNIINDDVKAIYFEFLYEVEDAVITLQKGETCDYKWVTKSELIKMRDDGALLTKRMQKFIKDLQ